MKGLFNETLSDPLHIEVPIPGPDGYPCLKYFVGYDNRPDAFTIVEFTNYKTGRVVFSSWDHPKGYFSRSWSEERFKPYQPGMFIQLRSKS